MKDAFRSMMLMAIGVNLTVFFIGFAGDLPELSLLALCSAGLCAVGYYNIKERDD